MVILRGVDRSSISSRIDSRITKISNRNRLGGGLSSEDVAIAMNLGESSYPRASIMA
jgi:hypothetical protein